MFTIRENPSSPEQLPYNLAQPRFVNMHGDTTIKQLPKDTLFLIVGQQQMPSATAIHTTNMLNMHPLLIITITNTPSQHLGAASKINTIQRPGSDLYLSCFPPFSGNTRILILDQHQQHITQDAYAPNISSLSLKQSPREADSPQCKEPLSNDTEIQQQQQQTNLKEIITSTPSQHIAPGRKINTMQRPGSDPHLSYFHLDQQQQHITQDAYAELMPNISSLSLKQSPREADSPQCKQSLSTDTELQQQQKQTNLKEIITSSKTINVELKCKPCQRTFAAQCYLTQHIKAIHSGKRPYCCVKCGKKFSTEDHYKIHFNKHNNSDKPYKCKICISAYHHKADLKRHIESAHRDYKKHVCYNCGRGFCRKDHLERHMEIHERRNLTKTGRMFRNDL